MPGPTLASRPRRNQGLGRRPTRGDMGLKPQESLTDQACASLGHAALRLAGQQGARRALASSQPQMSRPNLAPGFCFGRAPQPPPGAIFARGVRNSSRALLPPLPALPVFAARRFFLRVAPAPHRETWRNSDICGPDGLFSNDPYPASRKALGLQIRVTNEFFKGLSATSRRGVGRSWWRYHGASIKTGDTSKKASISLMYPK